MKKIKEGMILIDDADCTYKVLEVFKNSVVVSPLRNTGNLACEIISYECMDNEGWFIPNV